MDATQERVLNQPVLCPWTSSAPLQSAAVTKNSNMFASAKHFLNKSNVSPTLLSENNENIGFRKIINIGNKKDEECLNLDGMKNEMVNVKQSSGQFFHFLRLMQLFPNVHPATLHTVMTLCKNDFFVAVDKLLYAKRCKELYHSRKNLLQNIANKNSRFAPYPCNPSFCQNGSCMKPNIIKLDSKKIISRSRKLNTANQESPPRSTSDLPPVSLHCSVPIQPLSPTTAEDLSSSTTNDTIEVV